MVADVSPGLDAMQSALDAGDVTKMRQALLNLTSTELQLLGQEIGTDAVERSLRSAARSRRGLRRGKVIVLPGIMGSLLDSVDSSGDADRVWVNGPHLIGGRMADLELTVPAGLPAKSGVQVRTAGLVRKTYVPLLAELDTQWEVKPFPFDWREDMRTSAQRLDSEIQSFGGGLPVHLVAHSMGGLVARVLMRQFAATWASMSDPNQLRSGGRLVMLGTPNRGSFAVSLALSGGDKLVRRLALADLSHNLSELISILATFTGLYQMLPSPVQDLGGDDHVKLFDAIAWPAPVHQELLNRAKQFQLDLDRIIDPHRMVYVAGFNQETPHRIRIDSARDFRYDTTRDGDGRVPHSLGMLDGVTTYFVDEAHGDLPTNGLVLDAIHQLLSSGATTSMPSSLPRRVSSSRRGETAADLGGATELHGDAEVLAIASQSRAKAGRKLTPQEEIRLTTLITEDYLGSAGSDPTPRIASQPSMASIPFDVEVVWGDVTKISSQIYSVGHYHGVMPQRAELALDRMISGSDSTDGGIIAAQTRRGSMRGEVGDISYFPWTSSKPGHAAVAVAGMGRPGSFDASALRRLVKSLAVAVFELAEVPIWCTVLIGSGEGTLDPEAAALSWARGIADAVAEATPSAGRGLPKLVVAEMYHDRAERISRAFREAALDSEVAGTLALRTPAKPRSRRGRRLSAEDSNGLLIRALGELSDPAAPKELGRAWATLVGTLPISQSLQPDVERYVREEAGRSPSNSPAASHSSAVPARISFSDVGGVIRVAAIDETATVPERLIVIDNSLLVDLVRRMTDPRLDQVPMLCDMLNRFLIPHDFRTVVAGAGPFVFEVDRRMSQIHWEMCDDSNPIGSGQPLSVRSRVARQLRTTYSAAPSRPRTPRRPLRALVIGDPGDPANHHDLPGARSEALKVREILLSRGVLVDARIGAPSVPRNGDLADVGAADRLEVLYLLATGRYDLVHYAGHGDFDPNRPDRVGWLFASGLITPNELQSIEQAPALIVANACLSARSSMVDANGQPIDESEQRATLLPSLADEFFKLGVRDYIGTAWEVNDIGAERFSETMYSALLPYGNNPGETIGEAVRLARLRLWRDRTLFGPLWAAYQHFGDPNARLTP